MSRSRMRYLLFSFLLILGCVSDYKGLQFAMVDQMCVERILPLPLQTSWFDASIDVAGKHISGLLLIKNMPDSSNRVVFTNEAGLKFLDLEWKEDGDFNVHYVIKQLNRKAVIGLLRKDFELMLGVPFRDKALHAWKTDNAFFYGVSQKKETYYFITGADCASLLRIESRAGKKRQTSLWMYGSNRQQPDSMLLQHHTFAMKLELKKLARE